MNFSSRYSFVRLLSSQFCGFVAVLVLVGCTVTPNSQSSVYAQAEPVPLSPRMLPQQQFSGLKTEPSDLFAKPLYRDQERFARLEAVVQDMHNRLQALEAEKRTGQEAAVTPSIKPAPAPKVQKAIKKPEKRPYVPHVGTPVLKNIRMGDHAAKTRIVFESRGALKYQADLDNNEKLLTLFVEEGELDPMLAKVKQNSKLIKDISVVPQVKGGIIVISLVRETQIIRQGKIAPNGDNHLHRMYIDLKR